jgi:hypothetical protein
MLPPLLFLEYFITLNPKHAQHTMHSTACTAQHRRCTAIEMECSSSPQNIEVPALAELSVALTPSALRGTCPQWLLLLEKTDVVAVMVVLQGGRKA